MSTIYSTDEGLQIVLSKAEAVSLLLKVKEELDKNEETVELVLTIGVDSEY